MKNRQNRDPVVDTKNLPRASCRESPSIISSFVYIVESWQLSRVEYIFRNVLNVLKSSRFNVSDLVDRK